MSIIDKIKRGDEEAFAELIEQYKLSIYKTAKSILKDEDDVCDAIQDTALSIYKNINSLKNEQHFKTWVIRITINKCYDIIAKHKMNNDKILKMQSDELEVHNNFDSDVIIKTDLEKALELIDNDLKIVTVLYYYNDLSIKEIAEILSIPKGTVKSRVFRARENLYKILSTEEVNTIE